MRKQSIIYICSIILFTIIISSCTPVTNNSSGQVQKPTQQGQEVKNIDYSVRFVVESNSYPVKTPTNDYFYMMGDFNNNNPGDERYKLTRQATSGDYVLDLKMKAGSTIKFKFTRGTLNTIETGFAGTDAMERTYTFSYNGEIKKFSITGWKDIN